MPEDSDELIVNGYVVGSDKGKNKWVVRQKRTPNHYMDIKYKVASIHVGTILRPGLNVTFTIKTDGRGNELAYDVEEVIPKPSKPIISGTSKELAIKFLVDPLIENARYADAIALCKLAGYKLHLEFFEDGTIGFHITD